MKEYFVDCVEGLVLVVCEGECFCMMHACGDGVFKVCELQGGRREWIFLEEGTRQSWDWVL